MNKTTPLSPAAQMVKSAAEEAFWDPASDQPKNPELIAAAALAQPIGGGPLPTNYIDPEHQGENLELLQTFYQACQSEGGTADEICLRGIRAVLAARPATELEGSNG